MPPKFPQPRRAAPRNRGPASGAGLRAAAQGAWADVPAGLLGFLIRALQGLMAYWLLADLVFRASRFLHFLLGGLFCGSESVVFFAVLANVSLCFRRLLVVCGPRLSLFPDLPTSGSRQNPNSKESHVATHGKSVTVRSPTLQGLILHGLLGYFEPQSHALGGLP